MSTGNDLVSGALRNISSLSPGEAIPGGESDNALAVLNMMLASWSAENLMIPYRTLESFPLIPGQASYTIGPSANFATIRPDEITAVYRRDALNNDYSLIPYTKEQYNGIVTKSVTGLPQWYYYDTQYPSGILYLYPPDIQADTLFIESLKPINQFTTLQTTMALPGEYAEAIKYLLAHRLAVEYGFPIGQELAALIAEAKVRIMRKNVKPKAAGFDMVLQTPKNFNIYTG